MVEDIIIFAVKVYGTLMMAGLGALVLAFVGHIIFSIWGGR